MSVVSPSTLNPFKYYSHNISKVYNVPQKNIKENKEDLAKIFSEFLQNTSVLGLQRAGSRKGRIWKLSWVSMTFIGLAMAIYQSWNAIGDYLNHSVVQQISYESPSVLPFPSITVCSNIFLDEECLKKLSDQDPKLLKFLKWDKNSTSYSESIPKYQASYKTFSTYMLRHYWNESLRLKVCGPIEKRLEFIGLVPDPSFSFLSPERAEALGFLHQFHNFGFGCCFTVNPGFHGNVLNGRSKELLIQLNTDVKNRMIVSNDFFSSLLVHPTSTTPIMSSTDLVEVYPGDYIKIILKLVKLRKATSTNCIKSDDKNWPKQLALHNKKTPYIYTNLACEETCNQKILNWKFRPKEACLYVDSPVTPEIVKYDEFPTFCDSLIAIATLSKSNYTCNCPLPCEQNLVMKNIISTSGVNWNAHKNMIKLNETGLKGAEQIFLLSNYNSSMIRVTFESFQVEIINEQNKYSVADFWGIIGGNLGLWVGLCILSFIEVIELFSSIISNCCKS